MDKIIIETKSLSFQNMIYYQDIQINENKVNFIVGKSGTGKSTLLRLFNGTLSPSGGAVYYRGKDILTVDTINLRKEILLISQSLYLFDESIKENFNKFYEYRGKTVPSEQKMKEFLDICCIDFPLDKDCLTMSGGERQRVYTAIFLSFLPKVIMLDEPTSALDKQNSFNVIHNVLIFCKENGITAIIVSHDKELTDSFADTIITIEKREKV
ncbi:ATP-binding cassette domain-containing protein [Anaerocolumna sedimenticola]|uniref:ATP-binding cassette domain-containing protein n=1 Tax=Anaerocolumna sedimenticola TaxID=2696063 RepID=A0A6P1TSA8_9FIRM|nr:ATP-binding cassette domain-containing protein [Anaerocolumna sedimenticola]QHQ62385.1 ATP-binding cassette domain-containing protein [Anaerocolumna sedimenticola]